MQAPGEGADHARTGNTADSGTHSIPSPKQRRRDTEYDAFSGESPDCRSICSLNPILAGRSSSLALFGRDQLPHRSTLSRFLAALDQTPVEALRTLFQRDLLARNPFPTPFGLFDRTAGQWTVVDVDGTRQVARQRALPQTEALPAPHRRFDQVCAPGYQGASEEKWFVPVLLYFRHIPISFSAPLAVLATGITVANCDERFR